MINRISLDKSNVRAAAVSALGMISIQEPSLSSHIANILTLLEHDNDEEEVRHRSAYYIQLLQEQQESEDQKLKTKNSLEEEVMEDEHLDYLIAQMDNLICDKTYDLHNFNIFEPIKQMENKNKEKMTRTEKIHKKVKKGALKLEDNLQGNRGDKEVEKFLNDQIGTEIGTIVYSSETQNLSEEDFEYFVKARKHVFMNFVAIEFLVSNNSENKIENVQIKLGTIKF